MSQSWLDIKEGSVSYDYILYRARLCVLLTNRDEEAAFQMMKLPDPVLYDLARKAGVLRIVSPEGGAND